MGGFSLWHWIIVLFVLGILAAIIGLIIWLIVRVTRRPHAATAPSTPPAIATASSLTVESRLQELANLKSKGLITDSEYEERRSAILQSV
ncbi:SHOCT domain-containing protein [Luteimonas sp. A277]